MDRRHSRNARFTRDTTGGTPFDWELTDAAGLSATILGPRNGGGIEFTTASTQAGMLFQQSQYLQPGSYTLSGKSADIDQPERSRPVATVSCIDGRELAKRVLPNSQTAQGRFAAQVTVPSNCPVQTLALTARASDAVQGVSGRLEYFELRPAQPDERGSAR